MGKKEINAEKLMDYLSDPDNVFLNRTDLSLKVLGYNSQQALYRHFTTVELAEIEKQAFEERKRRSSAKRAIIYDVLYKRARDGDVGAIKEFLDRNEGKVTSKLQHSGGIEMRNRVEMVKAGVDDRQLSPNS